jgi:hypothetical protein
MTQIFVEGFDLGYSVVGLDDHIKAIVGTSTGVQCSLQNGLSALAGAGNGQIAMTLEASRECC